MHAATMMNCWPEFDRIAAKPRMMSRAVQIRQAHYRETVNNYAATQSHNRDRLASSLETPTHIGGPPTPSPGQ